ncbi:MAG: hypothetical protein WC763_05940 [Candidatus Paceibacterota bacterium]
MDYALPMGAGRCLRPPLILINVDAINDNDDKVLASLWEAWKISFQESRGWTSMDQWMASSGRIVRDPLPPHRGLVRSPDLTMILRCLGLQVVVAPAQRFVVVVRNILEGRVTKIVGIENQMTI